jgi:Zn-dependent protease with chaperone function
MNFFEQQERAERNTKRLIFLLCLAVISLIALTTLLFAATFYYLQLNQNGYQQGLSAWQGFTQAYSWKLVGTISLGVCAVVFLGSVYKLFQLSSGGRAVAEAMGGHLINLQTADADERKILNVVEEMAIASGTPVPPVYLIEERGINAFAAGHRPQDAVIGITRGCIHLLSRDELQGVIAHEFSHIYHGDMALNMRLVALLNGILLLGLIGSFLVRNSGNRIRYRSSKDKSPAAIFGVGIGLIVIGYTGTFFGNLIKAAVSRQREFLADASAVKFTRNPDGIAGALKKIGGYAGGSQLESSNACEFSHLYFSQGIRASFWQFMATHPPLEERIKRIEPRWSGIFPPVKYTEPSENFSAINSSIDDGIRAPINYIVNVDQLLQTIGQPTAQHLELAQKTLHAITDNIHTAAHNPWEAQALMLGLLLDKDTNKQQQQWAGLTRLYSSAQIASLQICAAEAFALTPALRLPVVELSMTALKELSASQYSVFKKALHFFIHADKQVNLLEWCFYHILMRNLEPRISRKQQWDITQLQKEACLLLSVIAHAGASTHANAQAAYNSSKTIIDLTASSLLDEASYSMVDLDVALARLHNLKPLQKPKLLKAISHCVMFDKKITITEAELFRAIADGLDCPIPPFIVANDA